MALLGFARRGLAMLLVSGGALAPAACALVLDFDLSSNVGRSVAEAGDGPQTVTDAGTGTDPCPGDGGMALVQVTQTGQRFCIDRREVSQADYAVFVRETKGDTGGQHPDCAFNTSYARAENVPLDECTTPPTPETTPDRPMTCIDWCDARAFCGWAGKRLCGKVGGGSTPWSLQQFDPAADQWFAACSEKGRFFYGGDYDPTRCNGGDRRDPEAGKLWNVGSHAACAGGPDSGVFDMIGNAGEFVDLCESWDGGRTDRCAFRGGTAGTEDERGGTIDAGRHEFLRCDAPPRDAGGTNTVATRNQGTEFIGFRCCADL